MNEIHKENSERKKDGRGDFFAVDRRAWNQVCALGMNAAVAYMVMARGTGGDNRTTKWSTNAIERYTGISRSRAQAAIRSLEASGAVRRSPNGKPSHPLYKLVPAHEVPGAEGYPLPFLSPAQARVYDRIGIEWTELTKSYHPIADELVEAGHAQIHNSGRHYRIVLYDAEKAATPDWIWLPNALVDGAASEVAPIELVRQTGDVLSLRFLINLYGSQNLDEDGGVHFRKLRQNFIRHKVGEQGPFIVWGFSPSDITGWRDAPFISVHKGVFQSEDERNAAWDEVWACFNQLRGLGLLEVVAHLVDSDSDEGEIIHPVAIPGTGTEIEQDVGQAALHAGMGLITPGQHSWAVDQNVQIIAPVMQHITKVQALGIVRLRYKPRTAKTGIFMARENEWKAVIARLKSIPDGQLATSRRHQG